MAEGATTRKPPRAPLGAAYGPPSAWLATGSTKLKAKMLKRWWWAGKGGPRLSRLGSAGFGSCHQGRDI